MTFAIVLIALAGLAVLAVSPRREPDRVPVRVRVRPNRPLYVMPHAPLEAEPDGACARDREPSSGSRGTYTASPAGAATSVFIIHI